MRVQFTRIIDKVFKITNTYVSSITFFVFGHFWRQSYENTKILHNLCLHLVGQAGQEQQKRKENHTTKVTKIPKTKRQNMG